MIAAARRRLRLLAASTCEFFDGPLTTYNPVPGIRADPADGAADDADHHHRRDRPLGGQHPRASAQRLRRAGQGPRHVDADRGHPGAARRRRCCGALNGFLVAYVGLPSLAVTIGTLALYRGLAVGLIRTDADRRVPGRVAGLADRADRRAPTSRTSSSRSSCWPSCSRVLLHFTSFGRGVFEIGLSAEAAHFSGVDVARTKLLLFVMSGVGGGARRHLLHAALRLRPRRHRRWLRAQGHRRGAARRGLDLRRPRRACTA